MNRGVALMGQYDYAGAATAFEAVLQLEPGLAEAEVNLAMALFNLGRKEDRDLDRADALLTRVLTRDPTHLRALYFRGIVLQHQGRAEEAISCFQTVVTQRPGDGAAWYLLGLCRQRTGQPAEADFLKAVEHRPYLFSAYYRLFQIAQARGDRQAAQGYLEKFKTLRESPLGESIELPQYNAMGDLALVQPFASDSAPAVTRSRYEPRPWRVVLQTDPRETGGENSGLAAADFNADGRVDLALVAPLRLYRAQEDGSFQAIPIAGASPEGSRSIALGDLDHDDRVDLLEVGTQGKAIWYGPTNGPWTASTLAPKEPVAPSPANSALLLDADHDGDLDVVVATEAGCEIWRNNTDGSFIDLALGAGWRMATVQATAVLPGDLDGDRDLDLVVLRRGAPVVILINELLGSYRISDPIELALRGDRGGMLQDLDGDGLLDLLLLGGEPTALTLAHGNGQGGFTVDPGFASVAGAAASWGDLVALRVGDVDLDGDLDAIVLGEAGHLLLNDGRGRFVLHPQAWELPEGAHPTSVALLDLDADHILDLLVLGTAEGKAAVWIAPGALSVPSTAMGLNPTGTRARDGRTRSPADGYGVQFVVRAGVREQVRLHTGLNGGPSQSRLPALVGLNGAAQADYVRLHWPDGVMQVELGLAAGQTHRIAELERKISSCPVLFTWNGERMEFVTDFAGVGGLGYFVAPGVCGQPQVLELVKVEPEQLKPRDGRYELSICEPMEETAYVDRLELLAVDHPATWSVYPDERAVADGPPPTHDLLVVEHPVFPVAARGPEGADCLERLRSRDRIYAYEPERDRRFIGFCREHSLELEFGPEFQALTPADRVSLFLSGYIEYPYSQTVYAASQAGVTWQAIRVERRNAEGRWEPLIPDGGWPDGMGRVFTLDLSGQTWGPETRLRLVTNLEIYYDQVFVARHAGSANTPVRSVPLVGALLQRMGFPREYSPDGRLPLIYDYHWVDATAPFHVLSGDYTRYGPVEELLRDFDDHYVLVAPGDEIQLRFDATALPPVAAGARRSFLLVSHAYCKDMDLYTCTPRTLTPLPFRGMSQYPYPEEEHFPDGAADREFRQAYNTRRLE